MLLREQLERRDDVAVTIAVEAGEERLQRAEIQLGQLGLAAQAAQAQRFAEDVEVRLADGDHEGDPEHRQPEDHGTQRDRAPGTDGDEPQDADRGERLATARADEIDDRLDALADQIGHGHEKQLGARLVHRIAKRAVEPLQHHRCDERAARADDRSAGDHDGERKEEQPSLHACATEQPRGDEELRDEPERVGDAVERRQVLPEQTGIGDGRGELRLEEVVDDGDGDGRDQHDAEDPPREGIVEEQTDGRAPGPTRVVLDATTAVTPPARRLVGRELDGGARECRQQEDAGREEHRGPR